MTTAMFMESQPLPPTETRANQRLALTWPVAAHLSGRPAAILDMGLVGAKLLHDGPALVSGSKEALVYHWRDVQMTLACSVVWTRAAYSASEPFFESGVTFHAVSLPAALTLAEMLMSSAFDQLEEHGVELESLQNLRLDADTTAILAPYLRVRFDGDRWFRERSFDSTQRPDGFTVLGGISEFDLERVSTAYSRSGTEARRLIRMTAELALALSQTAATLEAHLGVS